MELLSLMCQRPIFRIADTIICCVGGTIIDSVHRTRNESFPNAVFCITNCARTDTGTNLELREERPVPKKRHLKCSYMAERTALTRPKTSWLAGACDEQGMGRVLVDTAVRLVSS